MAEKLPYYYNTTVPYPSLITACDKDVWRTNIFDMQHKTT